MTEMKYKRESAKRVFAGEFRSCKFSEKFSTDEKAPTFILTPTGEIAARLLIVGVATSKERTTTKDKSNTIYRLRVNDGTGDFFISASSFQPEAMMQLAKIEVPAIVTVIGKPKVFTKEDGTIFTSVNAESVTVVDKETREIWKLETAKATTDRIHMMETGGIKAIDNIKEKYNTNLETYKSMVNKSLTRNAA
jgi:RPA family protein